MGRWGHSRHAHGHGEAGPRLHALALQVGARRRAAASRDVPRCSRRVFIVEVVGTGQPVGTQGVHGDERGVHQGREEGREDIEDVHGRLEEEDERGEDGDGDGEIGRAGGPRQSLLEVSSAAPSQETHS